MNQGDNYGDFRDYVDEKDIDNDTESEDKDVDKIKEKLKDPTSNQDDINQITINHVEDWKEIDDLLKINNYEL